MLFLTLTASDLGSEPSSFLCSQSKSHPKHDTQIAVVCCGNCRVGGMNGRMDGCRHEGGDRGRLEDEGRRKEVMVLWALMTMTVLPSQ